MYQTRIGNTAFRTGRKHNHVKVHVENADAIRQGVIDQYIHDALPMARLVHAAHAVSVVLERLQCVMRQAKAVEARTGAIEAAYTEQLRALLPDRAVRRYEGITASPGGGWEYRDGVRWAADRSLHELHTLQARLDKGQAVSGLDRVLIGHCETVSNELLALPQAA